MENSVNNSYAYKEQQKQQKEEKKIQPVATGTVKQKKKSGFTKFAEVFISEDVGNVKEYILKDLVVPTIISGLHGIIDICFKGGSGKYTSGDRFSTPKVSYRSYYSDPKDKGRYDKPAKVSTRFDYDSITYDCRADAEIVLDQMKDTICRYGMVTIGDMYEMSRLEPPYTSHKFGWLNKNDILGATTRRVSDGYVIDLPKAEPID